LPTLPWLRGLGLLEANFLDYASSYLRLILVFKVIRIEAENSEFGGGCKL